MASNANSPIEAHLITGPGDGIAPAVLLTVGKRLRGQYLFNIPEGFSRFVLEHKVRPTSNLRAAFATDLQSLVGFAGLAMRLRNEGHGQVHVLGPSGTQSMVTSLRHFIHWKHPAVLISELSEWEPPLCYEDEHIAVAALWKASLVPELWPAPEWLMGPALATQRERTSSGSSSDSGKNGGGSSSSSSSGSEEESSSESSSSSSSSSEEEEEDSESTGGSSGQGSSGKESSRRSGTVSHQVAGNPHPADTRAEPGSSDGQAAAAAAGQPAVQQAQTDSGAAPHLAAANGTATAATAAAAAAGEAASPQSMFDELDQIFMRGAGRASGGGPAGLKPGTRLNVLERLRAAQQGTGLPSPAQGSAAARNTAAAASAAAPGTAAARKAAVAAAAAPPRRRAHPAVGAPRPAQLAAMAAAAGAAASGASSAAAGSKAVGEASEQVYIVGGKPYRQVNSPGISAWVHDKLSSRARGVIPSSGSAAGSAGASDSLAAAKGEGSAPTAATSPLLGFLCHIKASDQLLLVGSVRGKGGVQLLQEHPALERMRQQGSRVAGVVLVVDGGASRNGQLRRLLASLPGEHVLMERPGAPGQGIGHLAAARTTAKLHLVSPTIFPLPASLATAQASVAKRGLASAGAGSAEEPNGSRQLGSAAAASGASEASAAAAAGIASLPVVAGAQQGQQSAEGSGSEAPEAVGLEAAEAGEPGSCEGQSKPQPDEPGGLEGALPTVTEQQRQQQERPQQLQRKQQRRQQRQGSNTQIHEVRHLSYAAWSAASPATAAAAAGAAPAPAPAALAAAAGAMPLSEPKVCLRLEPCELFTPEAAAGKGAEGRPSGADPAAVWQELREQKQELPAKLAELAGVAAALGSLPGQPRTAPAPNQLQPGQGQPQQLGAEQGQGHPGVQHQQLPWQSRQQQRQQQAQAGAGAGAGAGALPGGMQHPSLAAASPPLRPYHPPFPHMPFSPPQPPHHLQFQQQQQLGQQPPGFWPPGLCAQPPPAPPGMMWVLQPAHGYPQQQTYLSQPPYAHPLPPPSPPQHPPYYAHSQSGGPPSHPSGWAADRGYACATAAPATQQQQPWAQQGGGAGLPFRPPPPPGDPPSHPTSAPNGQLMQSGRPLGSPGLLGKRPGAEPAEGQQPSNKRAAADLRAKLLQKPGGSLQPEAAGAPMPAADFAAATAEGDPPATTADMAAATHAATAAAAAVPGPSSKQQGSATNPSASRAEAGLQAAQGSIEAPGQVSSEVAQWAAGAPECLRALAVEGDGTQVVFLGTGSAEPSKYRGASAIHLRLDCGRGLLLDCGEGCLGQMERLYGHWGALRQVASLGCIWLSHRHADHMLGLLGVLGAYPPTLPPLLVVGPYSARDWLAEAAPHLRLRYVFVHCQELNRDPGHWARRQLAEWLGIVQLESVGVRHCSDAYGVAVGHRSGWRLVYSGDTQPCNKLVQAGRGCTLLIHEATFEPCLADQAARKRHSTTEEALAVAQAMGAYRTILTHFSQRYPKFPEGLPQEGPAAASTAIAFDGMCVPLAALPLLPALRPAVEYVLASEEEAEEGAGAGVGAEAGGGQALAATAAGSGAAG